MLGASLGCSPGYLLVFVTHLQLLKLYETLKPASISHKEVFFFPSDLPLGGFIEVVDAHFKAAQPRFSLTKFQEVIISAKTPSDYINPKEALGQHLGRPIFCLRINPSF